MKYYLYDFDGTIYDGDSSVDFFKFCLKKDKSIYKMLPKLVIKFLAYKSKNITDTELKEFIFSFLKNFKNVDEIVKEFWKTHESKIKSFYLEKNHDQDIIISASPEFLVIPACEKIGIKNVMASIVNKQTGKYTGQWERTGGLRQSGSIRAYVYGNGQGGKAFFPGGS